MSKAWVFVLLAGMAGMAQAADHRDGPVALGDATVDITDVYAEAKGNGFDVKALRQIVRERKQDSNERAEQESILDVYRRALGMLADTPLGRAATEAATRAPPTRVRGYRPGNNRMAG